MSTNSEDIPQVVMEGLLIGAGYKRIAWDSVNASIRTPDGYDIDFVWTSQEDTLRATKFAYGHLVNKWHKDRMIKAFEDIISRAEYVLDQNVLKATELEAIIKVAKEALGKE